MMKNLIILFSISLLIGVTREIWANCFYSDKFDYNLSTGKAIHHVKRFKCEENIVNNKAILPKYEGFDYKMIQSITLDNFDFFYSYRFILPKSGETFWF